ncbi:hypothetical protein JXI42_03445 [bacterium]|nr:hypothetical protein [bacterium]
MNTENKHIQKRIKQLSWDVQGLADINPDVLIERAINFGGFDLIEYLQNRYGLERFKGVLLASRNLRRKAVNYWCYVLGIDREETKTFSKKQDEIWSPFN